MTCSFGERINFDERECDDKQFVFVLFGKDNFVLIKGVQAQTRVMVVFQVETLDDSHQLNSLYTSRKFCFSNLIGRSFVIDV